MLRFACCGCDLGGGGGFKKCVPLVFKLSKELSPSIGFGVSSCVSLIIYPILKEHSKFFNDFGKVALAPWRSCKQAVERKMDTHKKHCSNCSSFCFVVSLKAEAFQDKGVG